MSTQPIWHSRSSDGQVLKWGVFFRRFIRSLALTAIDGWSIHPLVASSGCLLAECQSKWCRASCPRAFSILAPPLWMFPTFYRLGTSLYDFCQIGDSRQNFSAFSPASPALSHGRHVKMIPQVTTTRREQSFSRALARPLCGDAPCMRP